MDKELLEMLEELNNILKDKLEKKNNLSNEIKKAIHKGFKEKASISIEKFKDGRAETHIEGNNIGILITLAGLEKTVLERLDVPKEAWELIKDTVGIGEAE